MYTTKNRKASGRAPGKFNRWIRRPRFGNLHRICALEETGIGHHPYLYGALRSVLLGTVVKGGKSCDCASIMLFCSGFSCFFFPSFPVRTDSLGKERLLKGKFPGSSCLPHFLLYHGWKETFGKPSEHLMRSFTHLSKPNIVKTSLQSPPSYKKLKKSLTPGEFSYGNGCQKP